MSVEFVPLTIEHWMTMRNKKNYTFWIVTTDDKCITGYFDGFDTLNDEESDHFLTYRNYYYFKSVNPELVLTQDYTNYEDDDTVDRISEHALSLIN